MTLEQFNNSLSEEYPPSELSDLLRSLWYDSKGDWHAAHDIADGYGTPEGDWVHAYLHRKEGDNWNADYWYRQAGRTRPELSLEEEWEEITRELLSITF